MINLTTDQVVFNCDGIELEAKLRTALRLSVDVNLQIFGYQDLDLGRVTTKSYVKAAYSKFISRRVLALKDHLLGATYVAAALNAYRQKSRYMTKEQFGHVMFPDDAGPLSFKSAYTGHIRVGLGIFLVALHSSGAITLPATFTWPATAKGSDGRRREISGSLGSEVLAFVRSLSTDDESTDSAFDAVSGDRKRKEWFLSYGTRLLLATGWHRPEDANIADLLQIRSAIGRSESGNGKDDVPFAYKALLDVLHRKFGDRVSITAEDWSAATRSEMKLNDSVSALDSLKQSQSQSTEVRSDSEIIQEILSVGPAWGAPDRLRKLARLPGLKFDLASMSSSWINLEMTYVAKIKRENYKGIIAAVGYWNIYLFLYLPYWFSRNQNAVLTFPATPNLLLGSLYVSRLVSPEATELPITFVEMMELLAKQREWSGNSHYAVMRSLKQFFEFIERYSDELPECVGFRQPLSDHDDPQTSRPRATKKQPVPRRFFSVYIDYNEALLAHLNVVTQLVVDGLICPQKRRRLEANKTVIDTFATCDLVGFIPILITPLKTIPLQFIPNVLYFSPRKLRDGRLVELPSPHGLHQNLVALHSGLRHNHIQWLDRDRFDQEVDDDAADFVLLFVNTDKKKLEPWTPSVNIRVIELLRAQRAWMNLVDEPLFGQMHFYNNNKRTKWPKFRPLFSYLKDGRPHPDDCYVEVWNRTLCGLQGLSESLSEFGRIRPLLALLPPNFDAKDPDLFKKLTAYGSQFAIGENCPLVVKTSTTPHSARVAVVSQYFTFLPADLIGKHITGQAPGVVPYYVHLEAESIELEQVRQAHVLREKALRSAFEPVISGNAKGSAFIHADSVNSNLARSMRVNLGETLDRFGCISISFTENLTKGVDVLRETRGIDSAANKTEICPYGNNCPPEIVKELRGMHRCSLCPYAVRSIDHLPAVVAAKRQCAELLDDLEHRLSADARTLNSKYSPEELDTFDDERSRLAEELTGWILNEEVLELTRQRIARGQDTRTWVVQRPEIIERDLTRVMLPATMTTYVLSRLGECVAYPTLDTPQIRARFDLMRRELLARAGDLRAAFADEVPVDVAGECAGLLRSIVAANDLTAAQLADLLERDIHLQALPSSPLKLLRQDGDI